jgi:hypothetical protein
MLCAKQDRWALIMDATDRERMTATLDARPQIPARVAAWRELLTANPVSVCVLPTAAIRQQLRDWLDVAVAPTTAAGSLDRPPVPASTPSAVAAGKPAYRVQLENFVATSPRLVSLLINSDALAAGIRIDGGNLRAAFRVAWPTDPWQSTDIAMPAPALHREGEFAFSGSGQFPEVISRGVMQSAAQTALNQLVSDNRRMAMDSELVVKFLSECDAAAGLVRSATVFHSPGRDEEGVYTNHFLAVRVESSEVFLASVGRIAAAWNELNERSQPPSKLVFETKPLQIAGKAAMQFSLDIVAADDLRDEPSMRQLMTRLFGPDRKLNRFAVQVDEHTVLLAGATQDQVASALKYLKDAAPSTWNATNTAIANHLTPEAPAWKLFFSPAGYVKWYKRMTDASFGEVIGAPPIDPFPLTPPVALSGSFPKGELSLDLAVPSDTLRIAQSYRLLRTRRVRAGQ